MLIKGKIKEYRGNKNCIVILTEDEDQAYVTVARTRGLRIKDEEDIQRFVYTHNLSAIAEFIPDKAEHLFITFTIDDPNSFNDIYRIVSTIIEGELPNEYGYQ